MKNKHTPGPWKYGGNLKTGGIAITGKSGLICETLADISDDHKANAKLIAAAPDLLAALELIRADINDPLMDWDQKTVVKRYVDYIDRVLNKLGEK